MENKWNEVLMTLGNHVPFPQVTVLLCEQDPSVKKWFKIVIVGTRVTWICARTVLYISTVLLLELRETLTVTPLLDIPLKCRVSLFVPRLYLLHFHRISWSCCYLRDLSRGLLLEGPVLNFRLLGFLYEVADERLYVTPLSSCRPSVCDPLLPPKPFVEFSLNSVWEFFTDVLDEARVSQK